jgi:hypothetical protein
MSAEVAPVTLRAEDAVELAELLEFLATWLDTTDRRIDLELLRFTGSMAYNLNDLLADLARFAFLLGGDGERFVHGADQ